MGTGHRALVLFQFVNSALYNRDCVALNVFFSNQPDDSDGTASCFLGSGLGLEFVVSFEYCVPLPWLMQSNCIHHAPDIK